MDATPCVAAPSCAAPFDAILLLVATPGPEAPERAPPACPPPAQKSAAPWTAADRAHDPPPASEPAAPTRLMHCSFHGDADGVRALLARGADVDRTDADGNTALVWACRGARNAAVVTALLDAGADASAASWDGSALLLACEAGDEALARLLLKRGARVMDEDGGASAALVAASGAGLTALVCELVETDGASLLEGSLLARYTLSTALWEASCGGHAAIVRYLLSKGADVDAVGHDGHTPLLIASVYGHARVVRVLLEHGANLFAQDRGGATALRLAKERGHTTAAATLEAAIAAWWSLEDGSCTGDSGSDGGDADPDGEGCDEDCDSGRRLAPPPRARGLFSVS